MHKVDLLVFDLVGTLTRSADDLAASVNHTLRTLGLPTLTPDAVRGFIGDGVKVLVKKALGPAQEHYDRAMGLFSAYYAEHLLDHTTLYPDVIETLDHFDRKNKVIVTNKLYQFTIRITTALGIAGRFREIIGEDSTPFKKPDPRLLRLVMSKWGAAPDRTVMIGDGVNDILLAQQAGAIGCAFLNGITEREKLLALSPDLTCEKLSDLKTLIG
jgi:phosphoglycolate phosphatase